MARVCCVALLACVVCVRVCLFLWLACATFAFRWQHGGLFLIRAGRLAGGALCREVGYHVCRDVQSQASCRAVVAETV